MGGTVFYDFYLLHRFLGISDMISLERHPDTYRRSRFNCPYDFIKVKNRTAAEFLASDRSKLRTIYWFDYDDGISPDVTTDILSLGRRLQPNGFAFVTVCAEPPGALIKMNTIERLDYFVEHMGDFAADLQQEDMENSNFPSTIHRILLAAFRRAFSARSDGKFNPLLQVQYNDSVMMSTVGGCFCSDGAISAMRERVAKDLPFLVSEKLPYHIRRINYTERERVLFDMAATKSSVASPQAKKLKSLGFKDSDLKSYNELIRFLPRYYESII
jgi:hypothetical protein